VRAYAEAGLGAGDDPHRVTYLLSELSLTGDEAPGALSDGEARRAALARALAPAPDILLLDKPTKHLDRATSNLLQELLAEYAGTGIVVSHDRDFLDRVATSVIVSKGEGRWQEYAGGYSDMLAHRGESVTAKQAAAQKRTPPRKTAPREALPHAVRRKLTFAQAHVLMTLPERIEILAAEIARLNVTLAEEIGSNKGVDSFDPPGDSSGEADACEEVAGGFVVAGGDGAPVLELSEYGLVAMALSVERSVIRDWLLAGAG
jgi:ATP-binding cassette subfamily F protein uup